MSAERIHLQSVTAIPTLQYSPPAAPNGDRWPARVSLTLGLLSVLDIAPFVTAWFGFDTFHVTALLDRTQFLLPVLALVLSMPGIACGVVGLFLKRDRKLALLGLGLSLVGFASFIWLAVEFLANLPNC